MCKHTGSESYTLIADTTQHTSLALWPPAIQEPNDLPPLSNWSHLGAVYVSACTLMSPTHSPTAKYLRLQCDHVAAASRQSYRSHGHPCLLPFPRVEPQGRGASLMQLAGWDFSSAGCILQQTQSFCCLSAAQDNNQQDRLSCSVSQKFSSIMNQEVQVKSFSAFCKNHTVNLFIVCIMSVSSDKTAFKSVKLMEIGGVGTKNFENTFLCLVLVCFTVRFKIRL